MVVVVVRWSLRGPEEQRKRKKVKRTRRKGKEEKQEGRKGKCNPTGFVLGKS